MYPTLAEILDMPVVAGGRPVVRAGRSALDSTVRWVHVSEQRDPAGTLSGGELLLSIGVAASDPATDPAGYLAGLAAAGAVGLMIELGQHLRALPDALVQAARAQAFPLIELRRTIRYVELTEAVHARVLTAQYAHLQFAERVGTTFRGLAVDGAPVERVVEQAAQLLGLPVVLEDLGHRALATAGGAPEHVLRDWTARSRQAPSGPAGDPAGPEGWASATIGRRGEHWSRLVVPVRATDDDRIPMVLTHAADTLTLLTIASSPAAAPSPAARGSAPSRRAQDLLLADLLAVPNATGPDLRARAGALGLPTGGHFATLVLTAATGPDPEVVAAAARAIRAPAVVGSLPGGAVAVVLPCHGADAERGTVDAFAEALADPRPDVVAAAGAPTFDAVADAIAQARHVADVVAASPAPNARPVWRARDLGVRGLVWELRDDPRLLRFVEITLAPVLRLEPAQRAEILHGLRAFADADGVVSAFAARIGTSRPAAYSRVRKMSDILGQDITDPLVKTSLQVAVLAGDYP